MSLNFFTAVVGSIGGGSIYGDINLCFDGNSLFRSQHENLVEQYMPMLVRDYLEPQCRSLTFNSLGVGGQALQTMVDNYSTNIDPLYDSNKLNVLVVTEDANGIGNGGDTGAGNVAKMNTYTDAAVATGWDIIIVMIRWRRRTPYPAHIGAPELQRFEDWLALVQGGALTNDVVLMNTYEFDNIGGAAGQAQDSYFFDNIHLSVLGNNYLAEQFEPVMDSVLFPYRV